MSGARIASMAEKHAGILSAISHHTMNMKQNCIHMNGIVLMEITKSEGSITKMMTQEEAEKLLDEWVERLGLQDWEIHLAWKCEPKEIPLSDAGGCASYNEETKEATIYILDE